MTGVLHDDEIPIDGRLVRALVDRAMPQCIDLPMRPVPSTGSTNALFRLGEDLLVRLPRQAGGSAAIEKEAKWFPVTWLRGRAWALSITVMIWYSWTTMAESRASRVAVGRDVLADAGYRV